MLHFERSKQVQTAVEQVVLKSWMTPSLQGLQGNISENTDVNLTLKALKMHWFILLGGEGPGVRITSAENIQCCSLKPPFSINSSLLGFTQDHQCILLVWRAVGGRVLPGGNRGELCCQEHSSVTHSAF